MSIVVAVLVLVTIAIAALLLAPGLAVGRVVCATAPDRPHPFGYKMAWLAIRTTDTAAVVEQLGLFRVQDANWESGLGTVYDDRLGDSHLFVSPPVEGWTFVVGLSLPAPVGDRFVDKAMPLIVRLATSFPDVQYFFSYPLIDFYAWARAVDGRLVRAFAIGENGVMWNQGRTTQQERSLGLRLFELRGVRGRRGDAGGELVLYPTETHVIELAARWGIDPTRIDSRPVQPALGAVGIAPLAWRPERRRQAA